MKHYFLFIMSMESIPLNFNIVFILGMFNGELFLIHGIYSVIFRSLTFIRTGSYRITPDYDYLYHMISLPLFQVFHNIGPGYDYLYHSKLGKYNPMAGQVDGLKFWKRALTKIKNQPTVAHLAHQSQSLSLSDIAITQSTSYE